MLTLLLLVVVAFSACRRVPMGRLRPLGGQILTLARGRRPPATDPSRPPCQLLSRQLVAPPRVLKASPSLADVAFDYERAVLELRDISDETKNRAIYLVARVIVPLVSRTRLADVTVEYEQGVADVLREYQPDPRAAVLVWHDLLRWGRVNALRVPWHRLPRHPRRSRLDTDFDL